MGAAVGGALRARGHDVVWASDGRSAETARRAGAARLRDLGTVDDVARASDVILSICPPHAALEVARGVNGFGGLYVEANAVSPATARAVATSVRRCVDGGIVGPPPRGRDRTRLYLSGAHANDAAELFAGTTVEPRVVTDEIGAASAVKMAYAAWSKGTAALLLAIRAVASAEGVEETLLAEWRESIPELPEQSLRAARAAAAKGWRWVGEMEEIAATFAAAGLPGGFHEAAAEVFRRSPRVDADEATVDRVVAGLRPPLSARSVGPRRVVQLPEDRAVDAFEVRPARVDDAREMAELMAAVAEERDGIATEPPVDLEQRTAWFARSARGSFNAVADGRIIGMLHVEERRGAGELAMLVDRGRRGRGVGSALVQAAIDWARAEGLYKLSLEVFPHNEVAIALYRRFGFVEEGRRIKQHRRASGELWDSILMGLVLGY